MSLRSLWVSGVQGGWSGAAEVSLSRCGLEEQLMVLEVELSTSDEIAGDLDRTVSATSSQNRRNGCGLKVMRGQRFQQVTGPLDKPAPLLPTTKTRPGA